MPHLSWSMANSSSATSLSVRRTLTVTSKTALGLARTRLLVRQPFRPDSRQSQASTSIGACPHRATFKSWAEFRSAKIKIGEHAQRLCSLVAVFMTLEEHFHSDTYNVAAVTELARFSTSIFSTTRTSLQTHAWSTLSTTTASAVPLTPSLLLTPS